MRSLAVGTFVLALSACASGPSLSQTAAGAAPDDGELGASSGTSGSPGSGTVGTSGASSTGASSSGTTTGSSTGSVSGGTAASGTGATTGGADAGFVSAEPSGLPQVANALGNQVLNPTNLVTLTFDGYPYAAQVQAFGDYLAQSDYIGKAAAEYGAGPLTNQSVALPSTVAPPAGDIALQEWLLAKMLAQTIPAPAGGFTPVYLLYYPFDAGITDELGNKSCVDFHGYHSAGAAGLLTSGYYYGVVVDCGLGLPEIETIASHEIAEATTDPAALSWNIEDSDSVWVKTYGITEIGDLCEGQTITFDGGPAAPQPTDGGPIVALPLDGGVFDGGTQTFTMQQLWSNKAAAAKQAPCVPVDPHRPYYNVFADSDHQTVPAGTNASFILTGYSSGPIADWNVIPQVWLGSGSTFTPTLAMTNQRFNNAVTAVLTLGVPAGTPSGAVAGANIYSYLGDGTSSYTPVIVSAQ